MNKKFLINYLNTDSPSNNEVEAQQLWAKVIKHLGCDNLIQDNYGNVAALIKDNRPYKPEQDRFKVVIDAHCDEIGWVISRITKEGFIYVKRNGGTDNDVTPGTKIKILTDSGEKISGFFGWIPIHLRDRENPPKIEAKNLFIDVGALSDKEVEDLGIELGNHVVVDREAEILHDKLVVGKSLDDKVGGFILSEVLAKLKEEKIELPFDLYLVNSVQEEVGLRGAHMISQKIKPDVAICFDVCFDTNTPMIDKNKWGDIKLNDGVVFRKGKDVHPKLFKLMKTVASENDINYKVSVEGGGGTNTTSYNLSNEGVVSSTLSIPLRYMHTQNEMISLNDLEIVIDYLVKLLKEIEYKHNFKNNIE